MDNFHIDVTSEDNLGEVLKLAFLNKRFATGFNKDKKQFVLFWTDDERSAPLPIPLTAEEITPIIQKWLDVQADYGLEPDIDGSCGKGFRVSCDDWGHIEPFGWAAFVKIEPAWAMHGK